MSTAEYRPNSKYQGGDDAFDRLNRTIDEAIASHPDLAFEYQAETLRFHIARLLEEFRLKSELTQIQMADKIGVSQSFIARLENPEANKLPTLETLSRVAHGLGKRLVIQFVDIPQVGPAVIDTLK